MGLLDGLFGNGLGDILGGWGQQNMSDEQRMAAQAQMASQQQYYEQLKQYDVKALPAPENK